MLVVGITACVHLSTDVHDLSYPSLQIPGTPVGMETGPHQIFSATLTLFQPRWSDYAYHIPSNFESHRGPVYYLTRYFIDFTGICRGGHAEPVAKPAVQWSGAVGGKTRKKTSVLP